MRSIQNLVFLIIATIIPVTVSHAEEVSKIWRWHEQGFEIYHPTLSANNKDIVFTRKLHEPDGHEAEAFSEKELAQHDERQKRNNRYADPEVMLLEIAKKKAQKIDWGWSPGISPDGQYIVYAYQQKPISGYRVLAETLAGNEIHEFNIFTSKIRTLAKPESGYLSNPFYSSNEEVIFSFSDAVNGAWGGDVGIGKVNSKTAKADVLYKPQRENGLYHLIDTVRSNNEDVLFIRKRPAESGIYLADSYYNELIQIGKNKEPSVIYDWGKIKLFNRVKVGYKIGPNGEIQVFKENQGWQPISNKKDGTRNIKEYGVVSPNGEYLVIPSKKNLIVKKFVDSKFSKTWKPNGELRDIKWSSDSKRVVLVITKYKGASEIFDFDELVVLEISK